MSEKEQKESINIERDLIALSSIFANAGFSLYLVGGWVRDFYLNRKNYDIDVATDAKPEDVIRLFRKTIPTGIKHGTVTIRFRKRSIECTTMRKDEDYIDGRHPDRVVYGSSIVEDLARRDFTMNAMAASLPSGEIIDPYHGKDDIKKGLIRAVGSPLMRFAEDGLRPIRAIRFASQLGFKIEDETLKAIPQSLNKVKLISIERFSDELNKIICAKHFDVGASLMRYLKIFEIFIPQLDGMKEDEFNNLLKAVANIDEKKHLLRLSLICYWVYKENEKKVEIINSMLKSLKYPNKTIEEVLHLILYCNFDETKMNTAPLLRFFLKDVGKEYVRDIFILKKAIIKTTSKNAPFDLEYIDSIEANIHSILKENPPLTIKELAINGSDLLKNGIKEGATLGEILIYLLDMVIKEPEKNQKDILLKESKRLFYLKYATSL